MDMYTRPCEAGQMIEVSYGYAGDGTAYCRTIDRSDQSESWARGELDWDLEPEHVDTDRAPCVTEWLPCEAP